MQKQNEYSQNIEKSKDRQNSKIKNDRNATTQEDLKTGSPKQPSSDTRQASTEGSGPPNEFPEFSPQPTPDSDVQLRGEINSQYKAPEDTV